MTKPMRSVSRWILLDSAGVTSLGGVAVGFLFLLLVMPLSSVADQTDGRLDDLFKDLRESSEANQAGAIEEKIWRIWLLSGNEQLDQLVEQGIQAMNVGELAMAVTIFDQVVSLAPGYAEGWNKRATVHYLMSNLEDSVRDIERTLALEPRHFGAISGLGLIFIARGDLEGALGAFESVLKIHPQSRGTRVQIRGIREHLKGKGV